MTGETRPKVSIISVVLNDREGLERTLESIRAQEYDRVELVVIDGGSKDGTIDIIKRNSTIVSQWISEADRGVYDAMNKGIQLAKGDFVLFLNAGDFFCDSGSLAALSSGIDETVGLVYGDVLFAKDSEKWTRTYPDSLDFEFFMDSSLPHPCTLIKRELFIQYGLYEVDIKISADWAKFLDLIAKHRVQYKHVARTISCFTLGGLSSNLKLVRAEKTGYLEANYSFYYKNFVELKSYRKAVNAIRRSRLLRMFRGFLPKSVKDVMTRQ